MSDDGQTKNTSSGDSKQIHSSNLSGSNLYLDDKSQVAPISLNVPTFWFQRPDLWFINIVSQFQTVAITREETKCYKLVAALPESIAAQVYSITSTPFQGDYEKLKRKILKDIQLSKEQRVDRLVNR